MNRNYAGDSAKAERWLQELLEIQDLVKANRPDRKIRTATPTSAAWELLINYQRMLSVTPELKDREL